MWLYIEAAKLILLRLFYQDFVSDSYFLFLRAKAVCKVFFHFLLTVGILVSNFDVDLKQAPSALRKDIEVHGNSRSAREGLVKLVKLARLKQYQAKF